MTTKQERVSDEIIEIHKRWLDGHISSDGDSHYLNTSDMAKLISTISDFREELQSYRAVIPKVKEAFEKIAEAHDNFYYIASHNEQGITLMAKREEWGNFSRSHDVALEVLTLLDSLEMERNSRD